MPCLLRKHSHSMKGHIKEAVKELFGKQPVLQIKNRHAVLRTLIIDALRRMQFFK